MRKVEILMGEHRADFELFDYGTGEIRVCITAGIHGDELSSVYAAELLMNYLSRRPPKSSRIRVIPKINQPALLALNRVSPVDGLNLNRIFPGDPAGSLSQRLARAVFEATREAEIIIDLHCCGEEFVPYLLGIYRESEKARDLMSRIPMAHAVHSHGTGGQLFIESIRQRDQAACIIELPTATIPGAINMPVAEKCFQALKSMLRSYGLLEGHPHELTPHFLGELKHYREESVGLWLPAVCKGTWVSIGQKAGTVNGLDRVFSEDGMVMSIRPASYLMTEGQRLYTWAQEEID